MKLNKIWNEKLYGITTNKKYQKYLLYIWNKCIIFQKKYTCTFLLVFFKQIDYYYYFFFLQGSARVFSILSFMFFSCMFIDVIS